MVVMERTTERLVTLVERLYPEWTGFSDPRFVKDEIEYKRRAVAKAHELLSADGLQRLIADGDWDKIIQRLDVVGRSTNLLYRAVPTEGDLGILYRSDLDKPAFCHAVLDLLHGEGESPERLQRYSDFVAGRGLPNKWAFPTYFLFLCHPENDILVKSDAARWLLKFVGSQAEFSSIPTAELYASILKIAAGLKVDLAAYRPTDMVDVQSLIWACRHAEPEPMTAEKRAAFMKLYGEFTKSYLETDEAMHFMAQYRTARTEALAQYQAIVEAADRGEDVTDRVLLHMLPYTDSPANIAKGAWGHPAPAVTGDVKLWFEKSGRAKPEDWPQISRAILHFVRRCCDNPAELAAACSEFSALPYSRGFQTGMLTPILSALRPDAFHLITSKSRQVLNYFAETSFTSNLSEYPNINKKAHQIVQLLQQAAAADGQLQEESVSDPWDLFAHWLVIVRKHPLVEPRYWKIAPGEGAWHWDECRRHGFISLGWDEIGDISRVTKATFESRRDALCAQHTGESGWSKTAVNQVWTFARIIREGDRIVANQGTKKIVGVGTVTGDYYFVHDAKHGHRVPVEWDDLTVRDIDEPSWVNTLRDLPKEKYLELIGGTVVLPHPECPFSPRAFELLTALHDQPKKAFYNAHKEEFHELLEKPFQDLLINAAKLLPPDIRDRMETEHNLFGRILKNDWGQGGAWDYYWGALYPKGGKRIEDAQLSLWMNRDLLEVGFYIGEYGSTQRQRFVKNCKENREALVEALHDSLSGDDLGFGKRSLRKVPAEPAWDAWLGKVDEAGIDVHVTVPRDKVLQMSTDDLTSVIAQTYERLFPLVLLAVSDDPLPLIGRYLHYDEHTDIKPEYPLEVCAAETGFELALLERWVRAIERKGQAIVYGPPGTGKTFIAERLARHLIGGGDGFVQLVQFHPAYAYEDFIQGIRPQARPDGGLHYPVVPGRFLEFCRESRACKGTCVLILDEINRANLARVFGELMYLLEYRDREVPLAGGGTLAIPGNVRIIGTMNTADRSIALVDHALRRRFAFLALHPKYEALQAFHTNTGFPVDKLVGCLLDLNRRIDDPHYQVGISFFMRSGLVDQVEDIWRMEIEPYLEEYFFDQAEAVDEFRWAKVGGRLGL